MSKHFPPELLQRITEVAQIEEVVADFIPLHKKGADLVGTCPKCQTKDKFSVSKGKNVAKCFKCGDKGWNNLTVINLVEYLKPCDFKEAVEHLTKKYNLEHLLDEPKVTVQEMAKKAATTIAKPSTKPTKPASVRKKPKVTGSFRDQTLAESGITTEMQRGKIVRSIRNQEFTEEDFDRYQSGTLNPRKNWTVEDTNVNMVMHYLGLDWKPMTYVPKQGNKSPKPMVRCRFENPQANARSGKVAKYISPKDSGLHLWLPNKLIRDFNQSAISAGILTFQEGEKKADRMCQVAPSVGIMGIHSLAKIDDPLPLEVEQLQKKFDFDTYIFFMDADLFEIGTSKDGSVDQRPRGFANAAKKFRHHINKFQREGKHIKILLAHPTTLDQGIKGMDDLLESGLITDAEMQKALADGVKGIDHEYVKFYDLTLRTDAQIDELWHIDKHVSFAKHYKDQIKAVFGDEKFKLGKQWRKFDEQGNLEFDQPLLPSEEFYGVWEDDEQKKAPKVTFSDTKLLTFLSNRGFYRYRETAAKNEDTTFTYIRVEDNTVVKIPDFDIRDFVLEFLDDQEDKQIFVRDHFRRNHENLLGKKTFGLLPFLEPTTLKDTRDTKYLTFKTPESNSVSVWTVTKDEVKPRTLDGSDICVWRSSLIDAAPSYCGPLFTIQKITPDRIAAMDANDRMLEVYSENIGRHTIQLTAEGEKTEFLKFLRNASNFAWKVYEDAFQAKLTELKRKDITGKDEDLIQQAHAYLKEHTPYTADQEFETQQHLIAKITAIGHLIRKYRSPDSDYWIYAMEGNLVEDDQSEGRSGKSLIPTILSFVFNVAYVDGTKDMERDIYIWDKVTPQTTFVNIDDARKGKVKVTSLYSRQVGSFGVRGMNKGEVLIPYEDAPVGYMSSNFNLMPNDGSTRDRWRTLAFSDFYTDERKPQEIHSHRFWYDWEENEMERFYSLLADCARGFLLCGGVEQGPSLMVDRRRWEAELGRPFLKWADATFLFPSDNDGVAVRTGVRVPKLVALGMENEKGDKTPETWSFYGTNPEQRTYVKELDFKKKLWKWALLRGYIINPKQPNPMKSLKEYQGLDYGGDLKSVGVEYFELYEPAQLAASKVEKKENDLPF